MRPHRARADRISRRSASQLHGRLGGLASSLSQRARRRRVGVVRRRGSRMEYGYARWHADLRARDIAAAVDVPLRPRTGSGYRGHRHLRREVGVYAGRAGEFLRASSPPILIVHFRLALIGLLSATPLVAQRNDVRLDVAVPQGAAVSEGTTVTVANLLAAPKTRELLRSGFTTGIHFRLELWREGRVVNDLSDRLDWDCLLYTSDAADERSSVDLGGRR